MKKSIIILALMLACFGIRALAGSENDCYVQALGKVYNGQDIKIGLIYTRIIFADGTFAEFRNRDVTAYRHHDKLYMMMPVICNNSDTLCLAMMEYITSKPGYTVFQYCCAVNPVEDRLTSAKKNYFFVFKEGKYYRRIDEDQTEALKAFGIKVI